MSQGKLIVISGASGVGKGTVLKLMMEQRKDLFFFRFRHHPAAPSR